MNQQSLTLDGQYDSTVYDNDQHQRMNALNLKWTLGFNFGINNGVHNLTDDLRKEIMYASAHTGVIYDYENNVQRLLQGHCNKITCTAYNQTEDIIITADSGKDSMLVIWDAKTGVPRKTIFDPHPFGVQALDISGDGQYIVAISKEENENTVQSISLWRWQDEVGPMVDLKMDPRIGDLQVHIKFNQDNIKEFATTGKRQFGGLDFSKIVFWSWEHNVQAFEFYCPYYYPTWTFKKFLTQTVFIPNSTQAVSGTYDGFIVVWDISLIMDNYSQPEERRAIKVVNLVNSGQKSDSKKANASINILKIQDQYLVVGTSQGSIRYYDFQYRIIAWFEDIDIGSITSISFAQTSLNMTQNFKELENQEDDDKPFDVPDFIVVDNEARIVSLKAQHFEEIDKNKKKGQVIMKSIVSSIISISIMPNSNQMILCCESGILYEWNFNEKSSILVPLRQFDNETGIPTCVDYSPNGKFLSVSTKVGSIYIYEVDKQEWVPVPLIVSETEKSKPKITMQTFASDSKHLATMDEEQAVCLFKIDHKYGNLDRPKEWCFSGKMRIHTLPIRSIAFADSTNEKGELKLRLFSIAEDKKLVEYDVQGSNQDNLKINSIYDAEQEYNPTACIQYPCNMNKEDVLLTTNEEYKIKLWQIVSNNSKICKKTCLGPTYGGPINKLLNLTPSNNNALNSDRYIAYSTKEKVVGLIKLPLIGNPNNTMGLIAHPGQITDISASSDGRFLMTSGGDDLSVNIWGIDVESLEFSFQQDKENLGDDPYPNFLQGGADGQTYRDLKDFFYYAQIRAKDEHTTKARKLDGLVPVENISEMMRALGYYPTLKEIENMQNEIRYSKFLETGQLQNELNLEIFVRLFVNHRPVYGIVKKQIEEALKVLQEDAQTQGKLSKDELMDILQKEGEKMSHEEIKNILTILTGNYEGLQQQIDSTYLIDEVLGFEDYDETTQMEQQEYVQAEMQHNNSQ